MESLWGGWGWFGGGRTLISELKISDAHKLIEDGYIGGGMLPKLNNCIDAIENGGISLQN